MIIVDPPYWLSLMQFCFGQKPGDQRSSRVQEWTKDDERKREKCIDYYVVNFKLI